jgi:hypothetical protein
LSARAAFVKVVTADGGLPANLGIRLNSRQINILSPRIAGQDAERHGPKLKFDCFTHEAIKIQSARCELVIQGRDDEGEAHKCNSRLSEMQLLRCFSTIKVR